MGGCLPDFGGVVRLPFDSGPLDQSRYRRDGPLTSLRTAANGSLFDDLVGAGEQRRRHGDAEGTGGLGMRLEYESAIG
jgi:hypothetical protein